MEFAAELQASLRELLWLRRVRESSCRGAISGVRIILPKNSCGIVAHRLAALDAQLAVELNEHDPALNILEEIDPRRAGNRDTWLVRNANRKLSSIRRGPCWIPSFHWRHGL